MSYDIVFKTIVVKKNNKIYHFSKCGRESWDYVVKVYDNKAQALKDIERFKGGFEEYLKLNSKLVNYDYYYRYLKKKIDKPITYKNFKNDYDYTFTTMKIFKIYCFNNQKYYTPKEFENVYQELKNKYGLVYSADYGDELEFEDLSNDLENLKIIISRKTNLQKLLGGN